MAMHVGRIIRGYANKISVPAKTLCAEIPPIAARSYSSGAGAGAGAGYSGPVVSFGEKFSAFALFTCVGYWFDWGNCRTRKESWIAYELRDLFESGEADLKIVEREIDAIKAKQRERGNKGKVRKEV